jgi:nucleoside-diphosphate-sugar epimerase
MDPISLARAARGADVIVHGFNVPYPQWRNSILAAADNVAEVAARERATILFPGNVYGLGRDYSTPLAEDADRDAPTELGELRNQVEERLTRATEHGARLIIVRAGDYFGPDAPNGWFEMMVKRARTGGAILDPAPADVPHAWAYLPDLARDAVDLIERRHELSPAETFHFAGHVITSAQMVAAIRDALGDPERKVRRFPWWALRAIAPFWSMGRKVLAMRYLWDEPVLLDGAKLDHLLQRKARTPIQRAVAAALGTTATGHAEVASEPLNAVSAAMGEPIRRS